MSAGTRTFDKNSKTMGVADALWKVCVFVVFTATVHTVRMAFVNTRCAVKTRPADAAAFFTYQYVRSTYLRGGAAKCAPGKDVETSILATFEAVGRKVTSPVVRRCRQGSPSMERSRDVCPYIPDSFVLGISRRCWRNVKTCSRDRKITLKLQKRRCRGIRTLKRATKVRICSG